MKLPIPDDWNGQDWACFEIQWPDSQLYRGLLLGFLSYLTRGRIWDETTGNIRDAQSVGWQVFNRNFPLVECSVCHDDNGNSGHDDNTPSQALLSAAIGRPSVDDEESEDMGQVVTDVQIVNGKIRVFFGPCCYRDLDGIDTSAGTDEEIDSPYAPPTGEDTTEYSACSKAWAVVDAIEKVLNAAYNVVLDNILPWTWPGKVENAMDMNLNDKWTTALIIDWMAFAPLITAENAFTDTDQQKSVAALVKVFKDDAAGVPDDATYEAVKNAIHTRGLVYDGFIMTAIAALGRTNLDKVAKLGAKAGETRTCGEPEPVPPDLIIPVAYDWAIILDFKLEKYGFNTVLESADRWVEGVGLTRTGGRYMAIPWAQRNVGNVASTLKFAAVHVVENEFTVNLGSHPSAYTAYVDPTIVFDDQGRLYKAAWEQKTCSLLMTNKSFALMSGQFSNDQGGLTDLTFTWDKAIIAGTGVKPWDDVPDF